jgi:hypothetical protein
MGCQVMEVYSIASDSLCRRLALRCWCTHMWLALAGPDCGCDLLQGEAGTGNVVEAVRHARAVTGAIRQLQTMDDDELYAYAKEMRVSVELLRQTKVSAVQDQCPHSHGAASIPNYSAAPEQGAALSPCHTHALSTACIACVAATALQCAGRRRGDRAAVRVATSKQPVWC